MALEQVCVDIRNFYRGRHRRCPDLAPTQMPAGQGRGEGAVSGTGAAGTAACPGSPNPSQTQGPCHPPWQVSVHCCPRSLPKVWTQHSAASQHPVCTVDGGLSRDLGPVQRRSPEDPHPMAAGSTDGLSVEVGGQPLLDLGTPLCTGPALHSMAHQPGRDSGETLRCRLKVQETPPWAAREP